MITSFRASQMPHILLMVLGSALFVPGFSHAAERPVLVELFTSQSCSSCPPADEVLGDLAKRPDILALSFHVDYWDNAAWTDPYAARWATARQKRYAEVLGAQVYTPQLVIDGRAETVGSDRNKVNALLRRSHADPVQASIHEANGRLDIRIGGSIAQSKVAATILLVTFDSMHKTPVEGGENEGRVLRTYNDVRSLRPVGVWRGEPVALNMVRDESDAGARAAVLVQSDDGTVWALAATTSGAS